MKPSKEAMFDYALGILALLIGMSLSILSNEFIAGVFGIATCDLLFTFGILQDLYKKEDLKA